jgi:hypothetical protein
VWYKSTKSTRVSRVARRWRRVAELEEWHRVTRGSHPYEGVTRVCYVVTGGGGRPKVILMLYGRTPACAMLVCTTAGIAVQLKEVGGGGGVEGGFSVRQC